MKKTLIGAALTLSLLVPFAASAATITNPTSIFDGQAEVYGNAGETKQATFQVDVPAGQVLHAIRTKVDGQATVCKEIGTVEGAQVTDVTVDITLPPNTNNTGYTLVTDLYYTDTLPQAQAMTGNLACTSSVTGSHVNTGAYSGGTVVNVLPTSGTTTGGSTTSTQDRIDQLTALVAQLVASIAHPTPTPIPPTSGACTEYASLKAGLSVGSDTRSGGSVGKFQSFLMYKGFDIPLLSSNQAPYGYFGVQTNSASMNFAMANGCN